MIDQAVARNLQIAQTSGCSADLPRFHLRLLHRLFHRCCPHHRQLNRSLRPKRRRRRRRQKRERRRRRRRVSLLRRRVWHRCPVVCARRCFQSTHASGAMTSACRSLSNTAVSSRAPNGAQRRHNRRVPLRRLPHRYPPTVHHAVRA